MSQKFLEKEGSVILNNFLVTARAQERVNLQMEATGAHNSSGQLNTVVDDGVMGDNISSEQVNSVVDVKGGTSSRERQCFNRSQDDHFTRDRRFPAGGRKCCHCGEIGHFKVNCHKKLPKDCYQGQRQTLYVDSDTEDMELNLTTNVSKQEIGVSVMYLHTGM